MTTALYIDFETRSPVDLKVHGLARYAKHPLTEPLMMAYAFGDDPVFLVEDNKLTGHHAAVAAHIEAGGIVVAHNAQFELAIFNFIMAKRYGWPRLAISQTRDTMAACYAQALPGALENAAHALGLAVAKDVEGHALMLKMCKPRGTGEGWTGRKCPACSGHGQFFATDSQSELACQACAGTGDEYGPILTYPDSPEMRARLGEYCKQDVAVEREIYKRVLPLMDREQRLWELDQVINLRGIPFDMPSLEAALVVADQEKERLNTEMARVTGNRVTACSAVAALKEWAADYGVIEDSLAKAEVNELLGEEYLPDVVSASPPAASPRSPNSAL
jgi:DNA polymerase